ncbi:MAG: SDR family oxidoreductase [Myxococcota bacterium]|nr:SDR family oxidoreductase [Myxococcota bacterium]
MTQVAFVTGASRGIGRAASIALAEAGFDVVVTARTVTEGETYDYGTTAGAPAERALPGSIELTAEEIRKRGRQALPIRLDLLERESLDAAVTKALATWGRIDLLLNNGIYQGAGVMDAFLDLPEDAMRRVFEGNVFAQVHLTRLVVRHMLERGSGTVINMTSTAATTDPFAPTGEGGWGFAYGASKGALHRLAGFLQVELGKRGIRAYNVDPGYVATEAQREILGEDDPIYQHQIRHGAPPEVPAAVIAWLATAQEAEAMGGQLVFAPSFCRDKGLVEGWPRNKK